MRRFLLILMLCLLTVFPALAEAQPTMPPVPALQTLPPEPVRIRISAAGDCTLGGEVKSGIYKRFDRCADENGLDYFLANVADIFTADDLTIVNLEGPLSSNGDRASKTYVMRGKPEYAQILSGASVEIANIANNHTMDLGQTAYDETLAALESAGIAASGGDILHIAEVADCRVGFVGYEKWNHSAQDAIDGVTAARGQCDILIASMHWGEEYDYTPESEQKKLGRALIDAGADLVIGHHPHVIQGVECYNDKYIIYSLGNFCFGGNTAPKDQDCYIFQQEFVFDGGSVSNGGIRIIPCAVSSTRSNNNYQPTPLTGDRADNLMGKILKLSDIGEPLWLTD